MVTPRSSNRSVPIELRGEPRAVECLVDEGDVVCGDRQLAPRVKVLIDAHMEPGRWS